MSSKVPDCDCSFAEKTEWLDSLKNAAVSKDILRAFHLLVMHPEHRLKRMVDVEANAELWSAYKSHLSGPRTVSGNIVELLKVYSNANRKRLTDENSELDDYDYLQDLVSRFFCFNPDILFFTVPKAKSAA